MNTNVMEYPGLASEVQLRQVEALQQLYIDCIDDERYAEWPELFTERCLYQIISRDSHRRRLPFGLLFCDSRMMLRDRIASMRNANIFEPHTYRHILGPTLLTRDDAGGLRAKTNYAVFRIMHDGAHELFSTGVYLDLIGQEGDGLKFKERVVVCDSSRIDALLVIPL